MIRFLQFLCLALCVACQTAGRDVRPAGAVAIEGRAVFAGDGSLTVHWPGSGARWMFTGDHLEADIEAETGDSWLNVTVDGVRRALQLKEGQHTYTLVEDAGAVLVDVSVTRRTGPQTGAVTFTAFRGGEIAPTPTRLRKVLIFGDSITVGYGVLGENERCGYSPDTEDYGETYAAALGGAFEAEVHAVAVSGRGIVRNWDGGEGAVFREMWAWMTPEGAPWDAGLFQPDAVLIALGTNDFSTADPGPAYAEAYANLLTQLSETYPGARIYAVTGPMLQPEAQALQDKAIEDALSASGVDTGRIHFTLSPSGRVRGCHSHPGLDTQALMAREVIRVLSEDLGWDVLQAD
ncbi:MAG: GDSL-type esterase/lipase family protein [Hyphomonas sp.]